MANILVKDGAEASKYFSANGAGTDVDPFIPNQYATGEIAHDSADSGNPIKVGGKALTADPTAVATGDRVNALFDKIGRPVVAPYALPENFVSGTTSDITDTSSTSLIAAQGSGVKTYLTTITIMNSHATVGTWVNVLDNATTKFSVYCAALGGGGTITLPVPLVGTANTAWNVQCVTTGANVRASAAGYKGV